MTELMVHTMVACAPPVGLRDPLTGRAGVQVEGGALRGAGSRHKGVLQERKFNGPAGEDAGASPLDAASEGT